MYTSTAFVRCLLFFKHAYFIRIGTLLASLFVIDHLFASHIHYLQYNCFLSREKTSSFRTFSRRRRYCYIFLVEIFVTLCTNNRKIQIAENFFTLKRSSHICGLWIVITEIKCTCIFSFARLNVRKKSLVQDHDKRTINRVQFSRVLTLC